MADELIDIFDEEFNFIRTAMKYEAHAKGWWHKIFFCWIIRKYEDGRWKALLQLRHKNKKIGGGLLDASSAGHFAAGENLEQALYREVLEELGLELDFKNIVNFGLGKRISGDDKIKNAEIVHKCYAITEQKLESLTLQREELDGIFELDFDDAIALFSDKQLQINLNGLIFDEKDQYKKKMKQVSVADFMDYGKNTYRDFFIKLKETLQTNEGDHYG